MNILLFSKENGLIVFVIKLFIIILYILLINSL
jgi:hypothetical protein